MGHRLWLPAVVIHLLGVVEIAPSPHHCFCTFLLFFQIDMLIGYCVLWLAVHGTERLVYITEVDNMRLPLHTSYDYIVRIMYE